MKINLDDPNLTAFALGELSDEEQAAMEQAVASSSEAQEFVAETQQLARLLRSDYAAEQHVDHKTELQELLARRRRQVVYSVVDAQGPAHDRRFTCAAVIDGIESGIGTGRTKKEAEQEAAREALASLD